MSQQYFIGSSTATPFLKIPKLFVWTDSRWYNFTPNSHHTKFGVICYLTFFVGRGDMLKGERVLVFGVTFLKRCDHQNGVMLTGTYTVKTTGT